MANESRMFRLSGEVGIERLADAVKSFLSISKGMEVQASPTSEGYVIQGSQPKDGWKTISGMRLAITVQMVQIDTTLNVTIGEGQWADKIGAGALAWFVAWPLAITAGIGAYNQKKLPAEIFDVIEKCIMSGGQTVVMSNAGAAVKEGMIVCPNCKTQNPEGSKFCNSCGEKLKNECPNCGAPITAGSKFCSQCGHAL
ncbi:MAG: zinc ribbon domain-containing protein [Eubacteriales bacterium]|nr:zinc ribbon domain-containing protein [Eubacteriales bacterium]